jgi:hypothetical protein
MKKDRKRMGAGALKVLLALTLMSPMAWSEEARGIRVELGEPVGTIAGDYCGLSFESKLLVPDRGMPRFFHGEREPLIGVFRQLGIKSLRVGGNTAERASVPIPAEGDIDHLFAFAGKAGAKVIYTLRMDGNTPEEAARIGRHVWDHHREHLDCFIIGNEPDKGRLYGDYYKKWKRFVGVINSEAFMPEATYCAPTSTGGTPAFAALMALDEKGSGRVEMIGQHFYAGGSSRGDHSRPEVALEEMMSLKWHAHYQDFHDQFVPHVLAHGHRYRLNETNSYSGGGVYGASDTFAAATWGLDYLYWWALHGASGINFHSGEKAYPGDPVIRKNVYTPVTSSDIGVHVQPLGYAIKAFSLVAPGAQILPVTLKGKPKELSLTAYCVNNPEERTLSLTLIHGAYGYFAEPVTIAWQLPVEASTGSTLLLAGKPGDIASEDGITLGGSRITDTGAWNGDWEPLEIGDPVIDITVPPASALIVRISY